MSIRIRDLSIQGRLHPEVDSRVIDNIIKEYTTLDIESIFCGLKSNFISPESSLVTRSL